MKFIPLSVPNLDGNEEKYVVNAIRDNWVSTGGSYITEFEQDMAKYLKVDSAVAVQSGTAALHLALRLSGIEREDEVIAPTLTFIAAINPIKYLSAHPIFIDCDDSLTIDPNKIREFIEKNCTFKEGKLINNITKHIIKAILVVHVFGNNADMETIMDIANKYSLKVIEDATEALGTYYTEGKYKGKYLGTIGEFGAYSFNGNKVITTGGGGMLVSNNEKLLQRAKYLSTQAKDDMLFFRHDEIGYNYRMTNLQAAMGKAQLESLERFIDTKMDKSTQAKDDMLFFRHDEIGYNYRMTNLQAAMGKAQLESLERFIDTKMDNYFKYKKIFEKSVSAKMLNIRLLDFNSNIRPNYWFYSLLIQHDIDLKDMVRFLESKKIGTRMIWQLISNQRPYQDDYKDNIDKAEFYQEHILNIPCSSNLSSDEVTYVTEEIINYLINIIL